MNVTVVTPPAATPVTLAEAKVHLRVLGTDDDTMILGLIKAATAFVERHLGMSLMERTLRLTLDDFSNAIELPNGPATEVVSVGYVDAAGLAQIVSPSVYTVDLTSRLQWVMLNSGSAWPSTLSAVNVVTITYKSGFTTLPDRLFDLRAAVLLLVGHWFANRETVVTGTITSELPFAVDAILQQHRQVLV